MIGDFALKLGKYREWNAEDDYQNRPRQVIRRLQSDLCPVGNGWWMEPDVGKIMELLP
jgi:hypothetical protein